ncbi:glycosyltransferase [Mycobacterium sp. smrl_JER01]|uniref:glycosyltransferase n=1 Tax=Mycobacterium sp. smrl_JER01 TaxID=3402633 RepID=UPI003AC0A7BA
MAVVLAYTAPAIGHLYPFCALLNEMAARGHEIHVRTLAAGVDLCLGQGFKAAPVDARIEQLQSAHTTRGVLRSAAETVRVLTERAVWEVDDFTDAVGAVDPDVILVDANCWGALSAAEAQSRPWLVFSPFIPYLRSPGLPPFGAGARPLRGPIGAVSNWGVGMVTGMVFDRPFRAGVRPVRAALGLPEVRSADQLLRRAPRLLVATGKPFEYPDTRWGDSVELIGPAIFDPPAQPPAWLDDIDRPIVLVTTSSVGQADRALVSAAVRAFAGDDVHVVASLPADEDGELCHRPGVTLARFVPHSLVLDRAVCVVTHGGMGITQKALDRGIPVCAVPFGRDQFEVARRIEVARCGVRLPARRLSAPRLRAAVNSALTRSAGAAEVAAGFAATGGVRRAADIVENSIPG